MDSVDSSPRSRGGDFNPDDSFTRLRFMCSFGGRIVPRPTDKSLSYINGETRMLALDRNVSLPQLLSKLSSTFLNNNKQFTLKYLLPNHDLDSLISVSTDEDLDNLIDEYDRLNTHPNINNKSSRIRLFLFPAKETGSEANSTIGSLLDDSKSESWFVDALNNSMPGENLLGMEEEGSVEVAGKVFDNLSSFGSAASGPVLSGIGEQFGGMGLGGKEGLSISPTENNSSRVFSSDDEKLSEKGGGRKTVVMQQQQRLGGQSEVLVNDSESRPFYINTNSDPKRESPVSSDFVYRGASPVPDAAASGYIVSSVPPEQFQQPQPIAHLHQQPQQQFIPANAHFVHHPVTGGVVPVSPYYHPIAAHSIQQSQQPQVYYLPVRQPAPYNMTTAMPAHTLGGPNSVQTAGKPTVPVPQVAATAAPQPELQYQTHASAPTQQTVVQPQLIRMAAPDQAHTYAGMGYHLVQQNHYSQPPATMGNFRYEYAAADPANTQVYYSQTTSPPGMAAPVAQYQAITSVAVPADTLAPGDVKATRTL